MRQEIPPTVPSVIESESAPIIDHFYRGYSLNLLRSMKLKASEIPTDDEVTAMMRKNLPEGFIWAKLMPTEIQVYSSCPMPDIE